MQTAAKLIVLVRKLTPRMEGRQDDLHAGLFLHRVQVNRHTPSVINDTDAAIPMESDINFIGMAPQGLVYGVIDDLLREVIGAGGIGIHAWAFAHRL